MKQDLREFAKLGFAHFMLWPTCVADSNQLTRTLAQFVQRGDLEALDCCLPFGHDNRQDLARLIRDANLEVVYAPHVFPTTKIAMSSPADNEQALVRLAMEDQIEAAASIGATGMIIVSGPDVAAAERPRARQAFADLCCWICGKIKPYGMTAMIEPFDRDFDKRFLYGPTAECVELIESLAPEVDNLGIQLDMAHVPLMGETFEQAIRTVALHLQHVHLGNCVMENTSDPFYGDRHPPIGYEGGVIDVPQVAEILSLLLDTGYLDETERGVLIIEAQPFPGLTVDQTIEDNLQRVHQAWRMV